MCVCLNFPSYMPVIMSCCLLYKRACRPHRVHAVSRGLLRQGPGLRQLHLLVRPASSSSFSSSTFSCKSTNELLLLFRVSPFLPRSPPGFMQPNQGSSFCEACPIGEVQPNAVRLRARGDILPSLLLLVVISSPLAHPALLSVCVYHTLAEPRLVLAVRQGKIQPSSRTGPVINGFGCAASFFVPSVLVPISIRIHLSFLPLPDLHAPLPLLPLVLLLLIPAVAGRMLDLPRRKLQLQYVILKIFDFLTTLLEKRTLTSPSRSLPCPLLTDAGSGSCSPCEIGKFADTQVSRRTLFLSFFVVFV